MDDPEKMFGRESRWLLVLDAMNILLKSTGSL